MSPTECSAALADAQGTISQLQFGLACMLALVLVYVAMRW